MKQRLLKIAEATNNSASSLSIKLNQSRGFIKQCSDGCNSNVLTKLIILYPNLNPYYLLTGEGDMWIDLTSKSKLSKLATDNLYYKVLYQQIKNLYESQSKSFEQYRAMYANLEEQNAKLIDELSEFKKLGIK